MSPKGQAPAHFADHMSGRKLRKQGTLGKGGILRPACSLLQNIPALRTSLELLKEKMAPRRRCWDSALQTPSPKRQEVTLSTTGGENALPDPAAAVLASPAHLLADVPWLLAFFGMLCSSCPCIDLPHVASDSTRHSHSLSFGLGTGTLSVVGAGGAAGRARGVREGRSTKGRGVLTLPGLVDSITHDPLQFRVWCQGSCSPHTQRGIHTHIHELIAAQNVPCALPGHPGCVGAASIVLFHSFWKLHLSPSRKAHSSGAPARGVDGGAKRCASLLVTPRPGWVTQECRA